MAKINKYEKQWKIETNISQFQIIQFDRKCKIKVKVGNKTHDCQNSGKVLGTLITKAGFTTHAQNIIQVTEHKLLFLFHF